METLVKIVGGAVLAATLIFALAVIGAWPTEIVVNSLFAPSLLVSIFGVAKIGFWQAFWLTFICSWLFKNSTSSSSKD